MISSKHLNLSQDIALGILLFLEIAVYSMYPVENINRVVDDDGDKHFKKRLKQFMVLGVVIAITLIILRKNTYLQTVAMTFLMVAILMAIGKYKSKKIFS